MTTMNETSKQDLRNYINQTLKSAGVLLTLLATLVLYAYCFGDSRLIDPLFGGIIGVMIATTNLFAIGYAFYILAIKKGNRWALLWPIGSFLAMCALAYGFAIFWPRLIVGFALGLTTPVIFGGVLVFMDKANPLDRQSK